MLKQQRLLEKAASLSSSPINLLQAIAAKALNFKLKKTGDLEDNSAEPEDMEMERAGTNSQERTEGLRKPRKLSSKTDELFNFSFFAFNQFREISHLFNSSNLYNLKKK